MSSRLARQVMELRLAAWSSIPRPSGSLSVHASGSDSVRILLISGGQALGYGVLSADLAFQGRLANRVSDATGQGVDIDVVTDPFMTAADAADATRRHDLTRFDAVVFLLGTAEAMSLGSLSAWDRGIGRIVALVREVRHPELSVFITTVPGVPRRPGQHVSLDTRVARWHATRLNRRLAEAVRGSGIDLLPFSTEVDVDQDRWRSSATYDQWAAQLAPAIAGAIGGTRVRRRRSTGRDENRRQAALDRLGTVGTEREDRFDQIVRTAREIFGVAAAGIGLIDREREWFKARIGGVPAQIERTDAICDVTIQQDGILVVPDALLDDRFSTNPFVTGPARMRFYAGFPIESDDGERIGALCIFDAEPRSFSPGDAAMLRDLALLAQEELSSGRRMTSSTAP